MQKTRPSGPALNGDLFPRTGPVTSSPSGLTSLLQTRAAAAAAMAAACAITAGLLCGGNTVLMLAVACVDGVAAAAWVGGATALGDVVLRGCRVRAAGPLRVATAGGLGLGIFSLVGLGVGLLGGLNRAVALALPIVGYALLAADLFRRGVVQRWDRDRLVGWLRAPPGAMWVWSIPAVSLTITVVAATIWPGVLWRDAGDPHPYDVTSYHLEVPREWYEAGRIVPLSHNMFSYFPMNAEAQSLLLMHAAGGPRGPWTAMYAAQFVSVGYTFLMLLAVAGAVGRGNAGPKWGPAVAAALASAVPWVVMLGGVLFVEAALMLYTALAVAWALRATEPGGSAAGSSPQFLVPLVVAGVMAGLACGVKITAVPMLLVAVPVAVVAAVGRSVPWRRLVIGCGSFVVVGGLVVAPWLVRNAAWAGNPLWPVGMSVLGRDHFSPGQVERFRVAHSPTPAERPLAARVGVLWRDVLAHWQFGYVLLPAAVAAAILRWRDRQTRVLVVTAMFVLVVWIGFTHLLPRFLVMVVPVAAVLVGRASAGRLWPVGLAVAVAAAVAGWAGVGPQLAAWSLPASRGGIYGLTDFSGIIADAPALADAVAAGKQIGIVGDAQAFFFQVPAARLHYHTVFDLPADQSDPIAAYADPAAERNPDWLLVVNPAEVARLHATYKFAPPLPAGWAKYGTETFLLRWDAAKQEWVAEKASG